MFSTLLTVPPALKIILPKILSTIKQTIITLNKKNEILHLPPAHNNDSAQDRAASFMLFA